MLTDWKDLQPKLTERLETLRDVELAQKMEDKLVDRWWAFRHQFERWKESQIIDKLWLPHAFDLVVREPFKTLFIPSLEDGDFPIGEIDRVAKEWMDSRDSFVLSLLPQEVQAMITNENGPQANDKPLQKLLLASLIFSGEYPDHSRNIDGVFRDRFGIYNSRRDRVNQEIIDDLIGFDIHERPWDWDCYDLKFDPLGHKVAKEVITLFGMDHQTATLSEMWACEQKFECLFCDDVSGKRWSGVVRPLICYLAYFDLTTRLRTNSSIGNMHNQSFLWQKDGARSSHKYTPGNPVACLAQYKPILMTFSLSN